MKEPRALWRGRRGHRLSAVVAAAALSAGALTPLALAPPALAAGDAPSRTAAEAEAGAAAEAAAQDAATNGAANGATNGAKGDAPATQAPTAQTPATEAESAASRQAKATGKPVDVAEQRDEHTRVLANPDGSFTWRQYVRPAFAKVGSAWQDADSTLKTGTDGRIRPAAPVFGLSFSGGGTPAGGGPLATMEKDGKSLSIGWPDPLPAPRVEGSTALYPEVLPGVDLKIAADVDGFAQHLVVKTPEAAAHPRLASLSFGLSGKGVELKADDKGRLSAVDGKGQELFSAPVPAMWDSSHLSVPQARALRSGEGTGEGEGGGQTETPPPARLKEMPTEVVGNTLRITPDAGMLKDPKTVFPVVIDPIFAGGNRVNWTMAYKQGSDLAGSSFWNGANFDDKLPRLGHEDRTNGTARPYFQMNTKGLGGARITRATFNIFNSYAYSCTAKPVDLGWTGPISPSTTWNNQPSWNGTLQTKTFAHGWGDSCKAAGEDFDSGALKDIVQHVADIDSPELTLGLRAANGTEGDKLSWKKFHNNPHLEIDYNRPPKVEWSAFFQGPWSPGGSGELQVACTEDPATWPTVGRTDLTLAARLSDPEGGTLTAAFAIWEYAGAGVASPRPQVNSGGTVTHTLRIADLADGKRYKWMVRAEDGIDASAYTPQCGFNVDKSAPPKPTVASADGHPLDVAAVPARQDRKIKFTSKDPSLDGFCYAMNNPLQTSSAKCGGAGTWVKADADGTATVTVKPGLWPNNRLHVQAYDRWGNSSLYDGNGVSSGAHEGTDTTLIVTKLPEFVHAPDGRVRGDLPGDLDGDGYVDLLATDKNGGARIYAGTGTGRHAGARTVADGGWDGVQIAHRGDFTAATEGQSKDGYEDWFVKIGNKLYLYPGDGTGSPLTTERKELIHPTGKDTGLVKVPGGKCVDVDHGRPENGTAIHVWDCNDGPGQHFQLTGNALKVPELGNKCVDIPNGVATNGTAVKLYDCNGTPAQRWVDRGNGGLFNPVTGLCLDLPNANTANGTPFTMFTCNGTPAQQFDIPGSWSGATQIIAPGNADGMAGSDLIVIESGKMVVYTGSAEGPLAADTGTYKLKPGKATGTTNWTHYDLISTGDVTGDGIPDLLGRLRSTDTTNASYGKLYLYEGSRADDGAGGTEYRIAHGRKVYGEGGWSPDNIPHLAGATNVQGKVQDQGGYLQFVPAEGQETGDFWAVHTGGANGTGELRFYPGLPTGHGSPSLVGNSSWTTTITGIF
ncbi:ricin-type beta-trefoil lectin domain protein [Streptomyces sp. TBY4]|uniref:ricin-type beta-trefoil lectin domain protein n=1 Tax=Streptomyces sp. TBY4 TaxID=2962030 RepID=UPI0020B7CF61|nr:ricin-type beta-trefoil lectin domain protein [Streptomyces sp. TBY4]MCP3759992.1 RICIN domain-containing protein [Streptomyces sp. TBY4]